MGTWVQILQPLPSLLLLVFIFVAIVCVFSDFSELLLWSLHFCTVWTTEVSDWLVYWSSNGFVVISLDAGNKEVSYFLPRAFVCVLVHAYTTQSGSLWFYICPYFLLPQLKVSLMCDFRAFSNVSWVYIYVYVDNQECARAFQSALWTSHSSAFRFKLFSLLLAQLLSPT